MAPSKVEYIEAGQTPCPRCARPARFVSQSGAWCERHLPLGDVPEWQMTEAISMVALLSDDLDIDGGGQVRLKGED